MKAIIIDDEKSAIEALQKKLKAYKDITVAGTASKGLDGIRLLRDTAPDLLFLDVEMPDMSGLEILQQMRLMNLSHCKVVVYTAHSAYMLPAFRSRAFDFLLKPIDDDELRKIVMRSYVADQPAPTAAADRNREKLLLYVNATDFRVVNTRDVCLFAYNHDERAWEALVAGRQEPIRLKRSATNDILLDIDPRFLQVSQRHIININYLMEVNDNVCQFYPPFDHVREVKVGRTFRKQLTERFSAL